MEIGSDIRIFSADYGEPDCVWCDAFAEHGIVVGFEPTGFASAARRIGTFSVQLLRSIGGTIHGRQRLLQRYLKLLRQLLLEDFPVHHSLLSFLNWPPFY